MKNKIFLAILSCVCLCSCYDNYIKDYDKVACGFANQTDVRSVVVGEGMQFSTGVALGGVIENKKDRTVNFEIDYSLVNDETLLAMKHHNFKYIADLMADVEALSVLPMSNYSLKSNSNYPGRVVIEKGTHLGVIDVKIDSAAFFAEDHYTPDFVIPIRIVSARDTDIIDGREYTVIGVRYEALLFGSYWHGGYMDVEGAEGTDRISYPTEIPQADSRVWTLSTVSPKSLTANAVGREYNSTAAQMKLTLEDDDTITIEAVPGARYQVVDEGDSRFIRARRLQDRKIALNYKYESEGLIYHVHDTLTFRNRLRDGVNEWQDENISHYE